MSENSFQENAETTKPVTALDKAFQDAKEINPGMTRLEFLVSLGSILTIISPPSTSKTEYKKEF